MELSEDDKVKVLKYFEEKAPHSVPCAVCGKEDWSVLEKTYELREFQSGTFALGGVVVPVLPIVCENCGNTLLISALKVGIIKSAAKKSKESRETNKEQISESQGGPKDE